ncbi:MAG: hypothetical protein CMJ40_11600 [Phycisphaerae bacterium]|nr:hypothetical protein [Phycisphaerae bacterium]
MNTARDIPTFPVERRGNALVLVAGALVLLVIIASAYLSSAQGIRQTAKAQRRTVNVDAAAGVIAEDIAREISEALFVREIDPAVVTTTVGASSMVQSLLNIAPLPPEVSSRFLEDRRLPLSGASYFGEFGGSQGRYEIDRNFAWNYAPYEVVPWTNWPDYGAAWHGFNELDVLPPGPNVIQVFDPEPLDDLFSIDNPPGQPGTSDTRWLRSLEPQRIATGNYDRMGLSRETNVDGFSHYNHLTNLARPGNDWRICRDIADVTGVRSPVHDALSTEAIIDPSSIAVAAPDGFFYFGGLQRDHHVPIEQWLPLAPSAGGIALRNDESGTTFFTTPSEFWSRWIRWFDYAGYAFAQGAALQFGNADLVPPNFYDLSNLDGDTVLSGGGSGEVLESLDDGANGERPEDEFSRGSARWHVSRVLTDADGDGFTDSFWFHVPGRGSEGTMQVVGVSVTDNGGRLNANAATRFIKSDTYFTNGDLRARTRGWSPSDLALVGQNAAWINGNDNGGWKRDSNDDTYNWGPYTHDSWNVGFFDVPAHSTGFSNLYVDVGLPQSPYKLVGYYDGGEDVIDLFPAEQGSAAEIYPLWQAKYFRDGTGGDLLTETSVQLNSWFPENSDINSQVNRLFFFRNAGSDPLNPRMSFTPFTMADEIELRSSEGNNQPWLMSRFERAMGDYGFTDINNSDEFIHPLRSARHRQEQSELVDQLSNRQLFFDNRRKLTMYNAARNDLLPPHLWWEYRGNRTTVYDSNGDVDPAFSIHGYPLGPPADLTRFVGPPQGPKTGLGSALVGTAGRQWANQAQAALGRADGAFGNIRNSTGTVLRSFYDQMRTKLDLREHERVIDTGLISGGTSAYRPLTFSERLPYALYLALHSGAMNPGALLATNPISRNLFDDPTDPADDLDARESARALAASYAANILSWRDPDSDAPLYSQNIQNTGTIYDGTRDYGPVRAPIFTDELLDPFELDPAYTAGTEEPAYLGMEMQPFIMEAFVAHVVKPFKPGGQRAAGTNNDRYEWDNDEADRLFLMYSEGDEDQADIVAAGTQSNVDETREILGDELEEPVSIAVVQIANPYDRPLPLFGRNPGTGFLDRRLPLYKVSLFGRDVVVDDRLVQMSEEGYDNSYTSEYAYNSGSAPWNLPARATAQLPLYLPPATPEAPFTLVLYATGFDLADVDERVEHLRWIDFLDLNAEDHFAFQGDDTRANSNGVLDQWVGVWPYDPSNPDLVPYQPHRFTLLRDEDGNGVAERAMPEESLATTDGILEIFPGDLICRVDLNASAGNDWSLDIEDFDSPVGEPDVTEGVAVALKRTHWRLLRNLVDSDGDGVADPKFTQLGPGTYEYVHDVVVDRTGKPSSSDDEFHEVVSDVLPQERIPSLLELGEIESVVEVGGGGGPGGGGNQQQESATFPTQPVFEELEDRIDSDIYDLLVAGQDATERAAVMDLRVPALADDTTWGAKSSADSLRWCQWARYTRAWGVDPDYPSDAASIATNVSEFPGPINHMDRSAPRYVVGKGQVTRSKGRSSFTGDPSAGTGPLSTDELDGTIYEGMEQTGGSFQSGGSACQIRLLNADQRTIGQRYFFDGTEGSFGGLPTNSVLAWGAVFDAASDPDGTHGEPCAPGSTSACPPELPLPGQPYWSAGSSATSSGSPWMTRNYRLPRTILGFGNRPLWLYSCRKPTFFDMDGPFVSTYSNGITNAIDLQNPQVSDWNGTTPWPVGQGFDSGAVLQSQTGAGTGRHIFNLADKGYYGYDGINGQRELMPYGFQMLQKDGNFEQVGEVLNVMLYGHELLMQNGPPSATSPVLTTRTFSEAMRDQLELDLGIIEQPVAAESESLFPGEDVRVNRLPVDAGQYGRHGTADRYADAAVGKVESPAGTDVWLSDIGHTAPDLPAAQRVLDLFVCDGPGNWDVYPELVNGSGLGFSDGVIDFPVQASSVLRYDPEFGNAEGFSGRPTGGLVNINTATAEVMRALPHMYKLVHGTPDWTSQADGGTPPWWLGSILESVDRETVQFDANPRVSVSEAIVRYRDAQGVYGSENGTPGNPGVGQTRAPSYQERIDAGLDQRSGFFTDVHSRGTNGFAGIGELFALNKTTRDLSGAELDWLAVDQNGTSAFEGLHDASGHDRYADSWRIDFAATNPFTREYYQRKRFKDRASGLSSPNLAGWYNTDPALLGADMRAYNPLGLAGANGRGAPRYHWMTRDGNQTAYDDDAVGPWGGEAPKVLSIGAPLSTDVNGEMFPNRFEGGSNGPWYPAPLPTWSLFSQQENYRGGDMVAGDAEEANLLFSGISNLITTRSDVFTVHFRIRTFSQNPETGVWDATDPDAILDDSRYVMLVDRSRVDTSDDSPRILYVQKVSN